MRHLLSAGDLELDEITAILDLAEEMSLVQSRPVKKLPALRGRTVVNLFFEDSTRTRSSFELAGKWLSADVINISAKGSSVSKGESLKDTAQTLEAMSADAVIIRHPASGAAARLAASGWIDAAVVNAGDGTHEHPTQAVLDARMRAAAEDFLVEELPSFEPTGSGEHLLLTVEKRGMNTAFAASTSPDSCAARNADASTSRARAVISCTFSTERIWPGILSSTLWHWSSMNATTESGSRPPPRTTSYRIRNSWNGSAAPTIRSSSA